MLHHRLDLCVSHNKIVALYFFASLSFLIAGLSLSLFTQAQTQIFHFIGQGPPPIDPPIFSSSTTHPYEDLGLRLFDFGMFLVAATFYQALTENAAVQKGFRNE